MANEIILAPDDDIIQQEQIENLIYTVRGVQVILDRDLARLYGVDTRSLNQSVKRNSTRFPERYMFQLTKDEAEYLLCSKSQNVTLKKQRGQNIKYLPFAFTEQGVTQLSAVLRSPTAVEASIRINDAFHAMRRFIAANGGMFQRIEALERHQIETDNKIDQILDRLEDGTLKEAAHIFSAGQIYDAKSFISELVASAKTRVILVDGYVEAKTIDLLDARAENVSATIYTYKVGKSLTVLMDEYNKQYPSKHLEIRKWATEQHDRWLVIDNQLWHCGASIKDAGRQTFCIDPINLDANIILTQL